MTKNLSEKLAETLVNCRFAPSVNGCSDEEITKLEASLSVSLPTSYKQFLSVMGKGAGDFEHDAYCTIDTLKEAQASAKRIIKQDDSGDGIAGGTNADSKFRLKTTDFVFLCGDYNFIYFDTTAGDDPPVIVVEELDKTPGITLPSFSEWLTYIKNKYEKLAN